MPQTARIRASADSVAEAVVVARVVLVLEAQLRRAGHHYLTTDIASETGTAASKVARLAPRVVAAWNARHPARPITYRNAERRPEHLGGYQRARFEEVRA